MRVRFRERKYPRRADFFVASERSHIATPGVFAQRESGDGEKITLLNNQSCKHVEREYREYAPCDPNAEAELGAQQPVESR